MFTLIMMWAIGLTILIGLISLVVVAPAVRWLERLANTKLF
jgi:hypothetical protein